MIAGRAIGDSALFMAGLNGACTIGGTAGERVATAVRWGPLPCPQYPGVLRERGLQRRVVPGCATICADFDLLNATIASKGDAAHFYWLPNGDVVTRAINATHCVQWSVVPALVRVQPADKVIGQLNTSEPLGILLAEAARDQDAHRVAMPHGQFRAVHTPR